MSSAADEYEVTLRDHWRRLAEPGTWWNGPERITIAAEARLAARGLPATKALPRAATDAARTVATAAPTIRPAKIASWAEDGLDDFAYVEVIGVVATVMALDVAAFGLGRAEEPLPQGRPGEPSRIRPAGAVKSDGWVPTVGPAWAPESLSAVTAERDAMIAMHGPLYLTMDQMFDLDITRNGMERPQLELVAARTSMLNDCFY